MKVLQAASSLYDWGGIERYVLYCTNGLESTGAQVHVACPPGSPLAQRLNGQMRPVSLKNRLSLPTLGKYLGLLNRGKYHVVHAHFSPDFMAVGIAGKLARTPLRVMTRHVAIPWTPAKVKRNMALFDHIIPVSDAVFKTLKKCGVTEHKMTVAKAGVPALQPNKSREEMRQELGISQLDMAVGSFGRLVEDKGLKIIVEAAALLTGVSFHIFGEGPEKGTLSRMIADRRLDEKVKLHGYVPDVVNAMNAMDAVAIPSIWPEAFPYAALEALSIGIPVIASKIGGLPELVRDGVNGLLFPAKDVEAFITNVLILKADQSLGPGLGETGKEIHRARYSVEQMGQRIAAVYTKELNFLGLDV